MKNNSRLIQMIAILLACSTFGFIRNASATTGSSVQQDKPANPFVGIWTPDPSDGQQVFIASLQVNEDKTFVAKFSDGRHEMTGGWNIKDNKLMLESEELKKHGEDLSATITDDGRLKLTKGTDQENSLYFVKK